MLNRRLLMYDTPAPDPGDGIITNGLVLRLSGTDKGSAGDYWIDRVYGIAFKNHGAVFAENSVEFNGSQYLSETTTGMEFPTKGSTFQICFQSRSYNSGRLFSTPASAVQQWNLGVFNNSLVVGTKNPPYPQKWPYRQTATFSFTTDRAFVNKKEVASVGSDFWTGNVRNTILIGAAMLNPGQVMDYFRGSLFEIRFYNRILSDEEILHNQQYDVDTYFGGAEPK